MAENEIQISGAFQKLLDGMTQAYQKAGANKKQMEELVAASKVLTAAYNNQIESETKVTQNFKLMDQAGLALALTIDKTGQASAKISMNLDRQAKATERAEKETRKLAKAEEERARQAAATEKATAYKSFKQQETERYTSSMYGFGGIGTAINQKYAPYVKEASSTAITQIEALKTKLLELSIAQQTSAKDFREMWAAAKDKSVIKGSLTEIEMAVYRYYNAVMKAKNEVNKLHEAEAKLAAELRRQTLQQNWESRNMSKNAAFFESKIGQYRGVVDPKSIAQLEAMSLKLMELARTEKLTQTQLESLFDVAVRGGTAFSAISNKMQVEMLRFASAVNTASASYKQLTATQMTQEYRKNTLPQVRGFIEQKFSPIRDTMSSGALLAYESAKTKLLQFAEAHRVSEASMQRMWDIASKGGRNFSGRIAPELQTRIMGVQSAFERAYAPAENLSQALGRVAGMLRHVAVYQGLYLMINQFQSAVTQVLELEKRLSEVQTISQNMPKSVREWAQELRPLAEKWGQDILVQTEAAYEALSNQVANARNASTFLESANKLATAGVTTTAKAGDLLASAINSFGLTMYDADKISASFFKTVDLGRVRVEEMANTYGDIAAPASQLGISFNELNAAIALTTIQGVKYSKASTYLRNIMVSLTNPTQHMLDLFREMGVSSGEELVSRMGGLVGVMGLLADRTNRSSTAIDTYIRRQAGLAGTIMLTKNNMKDYEAVYSKVANSQDLYTRAIELRMQTDEFSWKRQIEAAKQYIQLDFAGSLFYQLKAIMDAVGGIDNVTKSLLPLGKAMVTIWSAKKILEFFGVVGAGMASMNAGILRYTLLKVAANQSDAAAVAMSRAQVAAIAAQTVGEKQRLIAQVYIEQGMARRLAMERAMLDVQQLQRANAVMMNIALGVIAVGAYAVYKWYKSQKEEQDRILENMEKQFSYQQQMHEKRLSQAKTAYDELINSSLRTVEIQNAETLGVINKQLKNLGKQYLAAFDPVQNRMAEIGTALRKNLKEAEAYAKKEEAYTNRVKKFSEDLAERFTIKAVKIDMDEMQVEDQIPAAVSQTDKYAQALIEASMRGDRDSMVQNLENLRDSYNVELNYRTKLNKEKANLEREYQQTVADIQAERLKRYDSQDQNLIERGFDRLRELRRRAAELPEISKPEDTERYASVVKLMRDMASASEQISQANIKAAAADEEGRAKRAELIRQYDDYKDVIDASKNKLNDLILAKAEDFRTTKEALEKLKAAYTGIIESGKGIGQGTEILAKYRDELEKVVKIEQLKQVQFERAEYLRQLKEAATESKGAFDALTSALKDSQNQMTNLVSETGKVKTELDKVQPSWFELPVDVTGETKQQAKDAGLLKTETIKGVTFERVYPTQAWEAATKSYTALITAMKQPIPDQTAVETQLDILTNTLTVLKGVTDPVTSNYGAIENMLQQVAAIKADSGIVDTIVTTKQALQQTELLMLSAGKAYRDAVLSGVASAQQIQTLGQKFAETNAKYLELQKQAADEQTRINAEQAIAVKETFNVIDSSQKGFVSYSRMSLEGVVKYAEAHKDNLAGIVVQTKEGSQALSDFLTQNDAAARLQSQREKAAKEQITDTTDQVKNTLEKAKADIQEIESTDTRLKNSLSSFTGSMNQSLDTNIALTNQLLTNILAIEQVTARVNAMNAEVVVAETGKRIGAFANGGKTGTDSVMAMLTPGEFVMNRESTRKFYPQLVAMNSGIRREAGGPVTNFGDINISLTPSGNTQIDVVKLGRALKSEIRRGTLKL